MRPAVGSVDCAGDAAAVAYTGFFGGYRVRVILLAVGGAGLDALAGLLDSNPYLGLWPGPGPDQMPRYYRGFSLVAYVKPGLLRFVDGGAGARLQRRGGFNGFSLLLESRSGRALYSRSIVDGLPVVASGYASLRGPRPANEDSAVIASIAICRGNEKKALHAVFVADGAGGMMYGRQASAIAVLEALAGLIDVLADGGSISEGLSHGFKRADARVVEVLGRGRAASTLAAYVLTREELFYAWVGDTAILVMESGKPSIPTQLHRASFGSAHALTRFIGSGFASPDQDAMSAKGLEAVAALTDGAHDNLSIEDMSSIIRRARSPVEAAKRLVETAIARGGRDNATAVVTFVNHSKTT